MRKVGDCLQAAEEARKDERTVEDMCERERRPQLEQLMIDELEVRGDDRIRAAEVPRRQLSGGIMLRSVEIAASERLGS